MKVQAYASFRKLYRKLPAAIRRKVLRQIRQIAKNPQHPSLQVKRIRGTADIWEARVDLQYRMTFERHGDSIFLRVVANHDEALKNP